MHHISSHLGRFLVQPLWQACKLAIDLLEIDSVEHKFFCVGNTVFQIYNNFYTTFVTSGNFEDNTYPDTS